MITKYKSTSFLSGLLILTTLNIQSCSEENPTAKSNSPIQITTCPNNGTWCKSTHNKQQIEILFPKKIPYLKPFQVKVKLNKNNQTKIQPRKIQFSMQGMQMGTNRFIFKQSKQKSVWISQVVLPVCVSGRHDWLVNVETNKNNKFSFLISIE